MKTHKLGIQIFHRAENCVNFFTLTVTGIGGRILVIIRELVTGEEGN